MPSRILAAEQVARAPSLEVIRRQPKEVILTALARMGEQAPGFVYTAYIFTFGTVVLGASRDFLLTALIVCTALGFLWVPIAGHLSDRVGRRRMYMIGACFSGLYGFVYFALLETRSPVLIFLAIALSLIPIMTLYGPQAALIAESFYILACGVISIIAAVLLRDHTNKDIDEYDIGPF